MTHKKLSEREHILKRPSMYIGAVDLTTSNEYIAEDNSIQYKEVKYVPALIKIINEIIDNSVDVAIKTNFKSSNIINVKMDSKTIQVNDNGTGIPVKKTGEHYIPELCWGHARAGSNFDDDANRTQIGMNGVGSFATNCFSSKFIGKTDDGTHSYTITFTNNAESFKEMIKDTSGTTGTEVKFYPDLDRFGLTEIDDVHQNIIKQRLINLSMSYPEITFKFNSRKINVSSFKKYISLFSEHSEIYEDEDYKFAVIPNHEDDFRQFSYVNGLKIPDGGTHIDIITNNTVRYLREKLVKKYKSIKPGDIKNKLMVVAFLKNVPNTKFNSQSKEKITNSIAEITKYFGDIDWDKFNSKLFRNKEILDPITEVYRIKEEFKKRQELKNLNKTTKRIKSEKYRPATKVKKYLIIAEGASAVGGLMPVLGREECGFYELKGKPINAYSSSQGKFTGNKELSELYQIIQNEGYQYIVYGTDQDLDGIHIRGLLCGFVQRYLDEYKDKVCILQTPVQAVKKNRKLLRWTYELNDPSFKINKGEDSKYYKGLGSWPEKDLEYVIQTDGLQKMIEPLVFDNDELMDDWLSDKKADKRKEYIQGNEFSIAKV
jgi:DNA gyrase/topoisomerase IV subunit B